MMRLRTLGRSGNVEVFRAMKSVIILSVMILTAICLPSSCSRAQQATTNVQPPPGETKVLIVYLSRTNNTRAIAEFIRQKVGGRTPKGGSGMPLTSGEDIYPDRGE
jgi:hypothetical protein